jgi:hypothetical protein
VSKPIRHNFTATRQGYNPDFIVYHTTVGYQDAVYPWFNNPNSRVSAHYLVRLDGTIEQYVDIWHTAWHSGNWVTNLRSVGIEHADQNNPYDSVRTEELYHSSALLSAYIIRLRGWYVFPNWEDFSKSHFFVLHKNVQGASTACPAGLDIEKIKKLTFEILYPPQTIVIPPPPLQEKPNDLVDIETKTEKEIPTIPATTEATSPTQEETPTTPLPQENKEIKVENVEEEKEKELNLPNQESKECEVCRCDMLRDNRESIKNLIIKLIKLIISILIKK